jgi:sugar phosphate isomerase/epimerase
MVGHLKNLNFSKNMNRRIFIQQSLSAAAITLTANQLYAESKLSKFGCQLYSIRDILPKDPKGNMKLLADMGYKYFESYGADPLWGMSPAEAKTFFGDIGVKMVSAHVGLPGATDELMSKCAEAGLKYFICPAIGPQKSKEAWLEKADTFNKNGEMAKKHGLQYGYHNHSYSFTMNNGALGQKILLENTDPKLVCFELDMCWSEAAGADTVGHLKEYAGRYKLCHIKQLVSKEGKPMQTDLDKGVIDYKAILAQAKSSGVECFLVEQEEYPISPLASMKVDADYLKGFRF